MANPGELICGSGFGYEGDNGLWLITAAHIGLNTKPHEDWAKWAKSIYVALPSPHGFAACLFDDNKPRFQHLPTMGEKGLKPDVIAVPITAGQWALLADGFRLFTRSDVVQAQTGQEVIGKGYPTLVVGSWPGMMQEFTAIAEAHPLRIRFDSDMESGFSGGPLIDSRGRIVGVLDSSDSDQRGYAWEFDFVRLVSKL